MMFGNKEEGIMCIETSQRGLALQEFLKTEALTSLYLIDKLKSI